MGYTVEQDKKRFYVDGGEPGFNPSHNKAVIERSIKRHEENMRKRKAKEDELLMERVDAAATYLTSQKGASSGKTPEQYFGRKTLAYLRGENIVNEIQLRSQGLINRTLKT